MAALGLVILPVDQRGMDKWPLFQPSTPFLSLAIIPFPLITLAHSYSDSWYVHWVVCVCWIYSDFLPQLNRLPFLCLSGLPRETASSSVCFSSSPRSQRWQLTATEEQ